MPEGTLSFGKVGSWASLASDPMVLNRIMTSLRAADYASIRGVEDSIPDGCTEGCRSRERIDIQRMGD